MNTFSCRFGCGTILTYDFGVFGKEGKRIPTHLDGGVHECPNARYRLSNIRNYDDTLIRFALQIVANYNAKLTKKRIVLRVEEKQEDST